MKLPGRVPRMPPAFQCFRHTGEKSVRRRTSSAEERPDRPGPRRPSRDRRSGPRRRTRAPRSSRSVARPCPSPSAAGTIEVGHDAADDQDEDDVDGDRERPQVAAGQRRAAAERDVVGEVQDRQHDRDAQARGDRPDDGPRGVPELAPADLRPRPSRRERRRVAALGHPWPRMASVRRGGSVSGVWRASSSTASATRSSSSSVVKKPTLRRSASRLGIVRATSEDPRAELVERGLGGPAGDPERDQGAPSRGAASGRSRPGSRPAGRRRRRPSRGPRR